MKQTVKKLALVASIAATLGGRVAVVSAAVKDPDGGVWTYGSGDGGAYIIAQQLLVEKLVHLIRDMLVLEGLLVHGFVLLGERKLHSTIMFRMV